MTAVNAATIAASKRRNSLVVDVGGKFRAKYTAFDLYVILRKAKAACASLHVTISRRRLPAFKLRRTLRPTDESPPACRPNGGHLQPSRSLRPEALQRTYCSAP